MVAQFNALLTNFILIIFDNLTYQISDLERITGIKAHTIRIWERRFGIMKPYRTATNIRYYDDAHVQDLLNIATLLSQGYKISQIVNLTADEICNIILNKYNDAETQSHAVTAVFINDLISATLVFDEAAFEKIFSAVILRMGMYKTVVNVIYPFLEKLGVLWSCAELTPLQEHFASNIVRRKLIAAIDGLQTAYRKDKLFMLFLPPGEWHEIPLLFSDYIIRSAGYNTVYLGQNIHYENLPQAIEEVVPTHLVTFFISGAQPGVATKLANETEILKKDIKLLIGGPALRLQEIPASPSVKCITQPIDLLDAL